MLQDRQFVFIACRVSLTSDAKQTKPVVVFNFQSKFKIVVKVLNKLRKKQTKTKKLHDIGSDENLSTFCSTI